MKLSEIEWENLTLEKDRTYRSPQSESLEGVISIGRPFLFNAISLIQENEEKLDGQISLLSKTHNFFYLKIPINIRPGLSFDIQFVGLDVLLKSEGNDAICWSLDPMHVNQEIKVKTEAGLSAKLKLNLLEYGANLNEGKEYVLYQPTIEAFGLHESNPAWEIRAVEGKKISGILLFHMIIQVKKELPATAEVQLKADVFKKGFLWNYRAVNSDQSQQVFKINLFV